MDSGGLLSRRIEETNAKPTQLDHDKIHSILTRIVSTLQPLDFTLRTMVSVPNRLLKDRSSKRPRKLLVHRLLLLRRQVIDCGMGRVHRTTSSHKTVEVRSRLSGYLASTSFDEGQLVQAGDVNAVIDQRPFLSEVNRNEASVMDARAKLQQAKASVAESEAELQRAVIHRDLNKKILDRNVALRAQNAIAQQDTKSVKQTLPNLNRCCGFKDAR